MLIAQTAQESRTGNRRRNEDMCGYWRSPAGSCWCVSDGAGGHGGGDVAARLVVDSVLQRFAAAPEVSPENAIALLEAAHQAVMQAKQREGAADMHATCVLLLVDCERQLAVWGHAGDSRVYFFRQGCLQSQTRDHSLVQSMIDAGYGGTEMLRTHPQRSLLTSAIGNAGELHLSVSDEPLALEAGDSFLLCSDGWWEHVHEDQMQLSLRRSRGVHDWLQDMEQVLLQDGSSNRDNYTAIVVRLQENDSSTTTQLGLSSV